MDVKSADFLSLSSDDSTEVDERLMDVQTILCCLQSLTDHIASLENKHIATYRLHKKNEKEFDLGLIRHQMWLSAASQKIMAVERDLEWKHKELNCPGEAIPPPTGFKSILDESLNDGLAVPLEPERLWLVNSCYPRLPPRTLAPDEHDNNVRFDITENIKPAESKNQDNKNEFQEKVDRLRCKLAVKEKEPLTCLFSKKSSKILNNLKSLEDNMTKLNQLLSHLKGNTDGSSTKYESKNEINQDEFQKKDDRLRYSLAGKEEELCTCCSSFDSRGSNVMNKFNSIKDNMIKQNQLMNNLENNIDVCSTKYGHIKNQFDGFSSPSKPSMKTFDGSLVHKKFLDRHLETYVPKSSLFEDDGGVLKPQLPSPSLNLIQKEVLKPKPKPHIMYSVDFRPRVRRNVRECIPKNINSIMIQALNQGL